MVFGLLKDIKVGEYRVMSTPIEISDMTAQGIKAIVQSGAGAGAGFPDEAYAKAGAEIVATAEEVWARADFVAKIKEIEESEFGLLREDQIVFCCIHPAGHPEQVQALLKSKCIGVTAEDTHKHGSPNSEAAGKQGALFGLESMLTINGGKGKFVSGLAGAPGIRVLILGGGYVGRGALDIYARLGAHCTLMDLDLKVLHDINELYGSQVDTMFCTKESIRQLLPTTDIVVNCVKWPKHRKDFLIDKEMLKTMEPGSVLVDISNDDPGGIESSHETHHDNPRYVVNGVVHYCVSNIPGAVANTTSIAYAAERHPSFISILKNGLKEAMIRDPYLLRSLTTYKGILTHEETSAIQGLPWMRPEEALGIEDMDLEKVPPAAGSRSTNYLTKEMAGMA